MAGMAAMIKHPERTVAAREKRRIMVLSWLYKRGVTWADEVICEGLRRDQVIGALKSALKAGLAVRDAEDDDAWDLTPEGREYVRKQLLKHEADPTVRRAQQVVAATVEGW